MMLKIAFGPKKVKFVKKLRNMPKSEFCYILVKKVNCQWFFFKNLSSYESYDSHQPSVKKLERANNIQ